MGMFKKLQLSETIRSDIECEITPDPTFRTFSARGLREGLCRIKERICLCATTSSVRCSRKGVNQTI
jgi:hypothetical protein